MLSFINIYINIYEINSYKYFINNNIIDIINDYILRIIFSNIIYNR